MQSNSAGRPFRAHGFGPRVDPAECDALDRDNPEWLPDRRRYTWDPRVTGHVRFVYRPWDDNHGY